VWGVSATATLALASNALNAVERILTTGAKVQVEPNLIAAWAVDQPSNLQSEADGDPSLIQDFGDPQVPYCRIVRPIGTFPVESERRTETVALRLR